MRSLLTAAALLSASVAHAMPMQSAFTGLPSRFESLELTAGSRALGETCLSRATMPDGTVCDPAFLGEAEGNSLLGRLFLGNGYAAVSTANQFIYSPISKDFLKELFEQRNTTSLEANVGLVFTGRHFSAGFAPYRVQYYSEVHNPGDPVIAVHAAVERSFSLAGGGSLGDWFGESLRDFSAGARLRVLDRRYVHSQFSMVQVMIQSPGELVPVHAQRALLLDPAVGYVARRLPWRPRLSLGVSNLGKSWPDDPLYRDRVDAAVGIGAEPPVGFGSLRLGLDAVELVHGTGALERLRAGASYRFGILEGMAGATRNAATFGMQFTMQVLTVGIVYESQRQDLETLGAENRISTELAVKL
jgi:hypothetical protein